MNERIKQLETEAYKYVNSLIGPDDYNTEDAYRWNHRLMFNQKFAELIVKECASMARVFQSNEYDFTGDLDLDEFMLKHFGVEE